ncbi:MAG TPA: DUF1634 domain-containing protein [Chthonomonadales bacterium]|nr:DUF1634 domain-containing protein [Chthonomonadales bacterium]
MAPAAQGSHCGPPSARADLHAAVSLALGIGVGASFVLLTIAVAAALITSGAPTDRWPALVDPVTGAVHWPVAFSLGGLLVLMATPIVRLLVVFVWYWRSRERLYAWIAAGVLAVVLASVWVGLRAMPRREERLQTGAVHVSATMVRSR